MALWKVCKELGLRFCQSKDDLKAVLAEEDINNPSSEQMWETLDQLEEEHHAIIFLYKVDKQRFGKLVEEIDNDVLQKRIHSQ